MSACTDNILPIQPDECIGSSLIKINNNFNTLQTTTQDLVNRFDSTKNIRTFFYYGPNTETNIINGAYNYGAPFSTSARVYPVSHPAWSTFMNTYAVWTNPGTNALRNIQQNTYRKLTITQDGLYTIECQADNEVNVYVDGVLAASSVNFKSNITKKFVTLKVGLHTLYFRAKNTTGDLNWNTNPAGWACRITDSSSKVIWDTRTYAEEEVSYLPVGPTTKTVTTDNTTSRPSSLTIESFVNSNRELNLPTISRPGDIAYVIYQKTGFFTTKDPNIINDTTTVDIVNTFSPAFIIWKLTYNGIEYFVDSGFPKFTQALTSDTPNWNNPSAWEGNSY